MRASEGQAHPFGETANPAEYVPRDACESALRALERMVRSGRPTAVTAPPGLGKSLLLRLLGLRLGSRFRCLFLPYAAVTVDELCAWALGMLGSPEGADPRRELLQQTRDHAGRGDRLTLLIDDAGSMPLDTARGLGEVIRDSGNRIRVVLAAADGALSSRVLAALYPDVVEVRFRDPMTLFETQAYVQTRLEQAGVREAVRERFDAEALGSIHRRSGGVPRRVHDLAALLLDSAPDGVGRAWKEERWLGAASEGEDGLETDRIEAEEGDCDPRPVNTPALILDGDDPLSS